MTETFPTFWERNKILIKGFLIGFLILIMLIPTAFLFSLVRERQNRQEEVISEVSNKWASQQTIKGPILLVPYKTEETNDQGKLVQVIRNAYFLPDVLTIDGNLKPEERHRSLYNVTLYKSDLVLSGEFHPLPVQKLQLAPENMLWNDAHLLLGINDARGLEDEVSLMWNNTTQQLEAGVPENNVLKEGLSVPVSIDSQKATSFAINIHLKGSSYLYFTPVGKTTDVTIQSSWKDPAFDGAYLPTQTPVVANNGFTAKWKVLQVSRNYPQFWKEENYKLDSSAFGVKLLQPTDSYAKTDRSVKYAILFIALTFIIFFFLEIFQKKQIHPLQYLLVGFALSIFYTLLLSISEYTGFNIAYLIASTATVGLIGLYVWGIFRQIKITLGFTVALGALYTYIFILIQLQDYALLFGSIGLFIILAIIMYYSRKIDWYGMGKHQLEHRAI